jgi:hypothetical protein
MSDPSTEVSFNRNTPGHSITCDTTVCVAESPNASASFRNPTFVAWNYQSFGVWAKEMGPASWAVGAISAGNTTLVSGMPTTGFFNFAASASGFYVDTSGTPFTTTSGVNIGVDFEMRTVRYTTVDTTFVNVNTQARTTHTLLNINGTMNYAPGSVVFSGPLETSDGALKGDGTGRFYGPNAQEIGGNFRLEGNGVSRWIGAFGGSR